MTEGLLTGDGIAAANAGWTFGGDTPKHFKAHVSRSVPHYEAGHGIIEELSDFFVKRSSLCYDLGSSTGTLTLKLAARHAPEVRWIGLDIEDSMVKQARSELEGTKPSGNVEFQAADIVAYEYQPCDFIVAYYTVQFIPPRQRQNLIDAIYAALNWGGAFVMFEKVRAPDARFQDIATALYIDYKLAKGYSPQEIIGKSKSLKGVLEPFSTSGNMDLLKRAGFQDIMTVFKHVCFEGFFCIK